MRIGDHDLVQLTETEIEENTIKVAKITLHPNYGNNNYIVVCLSIFDKPESKLQVLIKSQPDSVFVQRKIQMGILKQSLGAE